MKKIRDQLNSARERGAVMVIVAATTVVVLLAGAAAVDLSAMATRGQTLQNAADAAALAGVETWVETGDQSQATALVNDILNQNGIGNGDSTIANVTFPSPNDIDVELVDSDPDVFLGGVAGFDSSISRAATARFERCDQSCTYDVEIPPPFAAVEAVGSGDGYKPIPVENKLYAIHHDGYQIVCVDRTTQLPCWSPTARTAYHGSAVDWHWDTNPHMPHVAVVGSTIWWSTTDSIGHKMVCWETTTDTPCSQSWLLAALPEADDLHNYESNRGGGTAFVGGNIYVFTDDYKAHCFDPIARAICSGWAGGRSTTLGLAGFPAHNPDDGNHGSSMDRVIDNGKIYSTIHVVSATPAIDCTQPMETPAGIVVIESYDRPGQYIARRNNSDTRFRTNPLNDRTWWQVTDRGGGEYSFRNIDNNRYMDGESSGNVELSSSNNSDDDWIPVWYPASQTVTLQNDVYGNYIRDNGSDVRLSNSVSGFDEHWQIWPRECKDPGYVPPATSPPAWYDTGVWLDCFDTTTGAPCAGFNARRLHTNSWRASGRVWFYRDTNGNATGVCSSGFDGSINSGNFEIDCVDMLGNPSGGMNSVMMTYANAIRTTIGSSLSSWGDPHWNEDSNRTFYPSHHNPAKVFCWDWDSNTYCGSRTQTSPSNGITEDYGYFSEGNCVYGLGHNSIFWAFNAEDINQECTGSSAHTRIYPCNCGLTQQWGIIEFEVDLPLYDEFDIVVEDPNGNQVFPPLPAEAWSLIDDGTVVDLNDIPTTHAYLEIVVTVETEHDPWASGAQTFSIEFARQPHLTD